MAGQRTQQLADRIKVIVASMLERRVKDPRLVVEFVRRARDARAAQVTDPAP